MNGFIGKLLRCWLLLACFGFIVACNSSSSTKQLSATAQLTIDGQRTQQSVPIQVEQTGRSWVPVQEAMDALNLKTQQASDQTFRFGHTDPLYTVKAGEFTATAGDQKVSLPRAPQVWDGRLYMTVEALSALLKTEVTWNAAKGELNIVSPSMQIAEPPQGATIQSVANLNGIDMVRFAEKFLGVPYEFGTDDYRRTGKFDCSSFTQYVYDRFGVDIPRSSMAQSHVGKRISINSLKPGDLLFFFTPGRYSSNKIVGHVGIYAGQGKIIHTYGEPGVTKSELGGYWEKRLLFAKRL